MAVSETQEAHGHDQLPAGLHELCKAIDGKLHLLASTGDGELSAAALQGAKRIFELGLKCENHSHPHLHPFLLQTLQPPSVSLRSKTKKSKAKSPSPEPEIPDPAEILPYTPLTELTVDGLDVEQIWAQLELRSEGIVRIVKELGPGDQADMDDMDGSGSDLESDEEESGESDEEMTEEEWKQMLLDNGIDEDADSDGMGSGESDEDDEDEEEGDEDSDDEENMIRWKDEMDGSEEEGSEDDEDEVDELEDEEMESGEEDEDEDEDDDEGEDEDEDIEDDGDEDDGEEAEDDKSALFGDEPGPSRRARHPTLDDEFFSIDEFNALTEQMEAGKSTSGKLGGEDEDEDEDDLGDAGALMLESAPDEDKDIMYQDFFAQPRGVKPKPKGKGKDSAKKDKKGKGKAKGVSFDDEDEEMGSDVDEEEEEEEGGRDIMGRFKGDLFDSDDEGDAGEKTMSTHEKQQLALAKQIADLEQQAVGPKDWTLLGEATSRARPENSLLEEDLDFEQMGKVVPVVTEERVQSLEELIKKRIIDNNFDSTVRVRAYEPTPYLPSRYFDLQDSQSAKSLAQIYEEEYQAQAAGGAVKDPRDEKLKKEHEEIDKLWGEICYKLDALSSLNFVPKQPKAQITTIDNLPTASLESALPPTAAATSLLAPEEMFAPPTTSALVARSELNPEEAQAARLKRKREQKADRKKLGEMAELYGKRKGSVKAEKERAMQNLVKTGKGVTVVGKSAKEQGKAGRRAVAAQETRTDSKRLKL